MTVQSVCQVVARVDNGLHFMTTRATESEDAIAAFGQRRINTESGDGDGQGKSLRIQRFKLVEPK